MGEYGLSYDELLKEGEAYQDFLMLELAKQGLFIQCFGSKRYQYQYGESVQGIEIKYDKQSEKTGNLYIEVAEKTNPNRESYMPSGIMRDDNTWLYIVGNRTSAFVMGKKYLRNMYFQARSRSMNGVELKETPTSQGMIIDIETARKWVVVKEFYFERPFRYEEE